MTRISLLQKLRSTLRAFKSDRRGNIATVFALASLPVVAAVGTAVDYSNANAARTTMQMALDSTALMLSKEAASITDTALDTKATSYFNALYTRKDVTGVQVGATYSTTNGSQVVVTGSGNVKVSFMGIMGFSNLAIRGTATVVWGQQRMRVALAFDTTGSMDEDGKMEAAKTAAKSLIKQLKDASKKDGDIYVSLIPFNKDVNASDLLPNGNSDTILGGLNWLRWDLWEALNGDCSKDSKKKEYPNIVSCTLAGGFWTFEKKKEWNGCITDRDQDYDVKNTSPLLSLLGSRFPTETYDDCPKEMMGLSNDWGKLNGRIESLKPQGNTNQVIGLQWAFQSLTAAPFTIPAKDPLYTYNDIIILMTDGLNTQNRFSNNQSDIDAREKKLCANIKAANVTIYTIHVNTGGDPEQQVLKDCASDATKYFQIKQSNQLVSIFTQIGSQLSQLRISK